MYDMTIRFCMDKNKCMYQQIYEHIKQEIKEGKLLAGEKLPSTRFLSQYLQVARSTVNYAYEQLLSEGYIEARPYKGYFVCDMEDLFQMEDKPLKADGFAEKKKQESPVENFTILQKDNHYLYDFSPNEIDMTYFPFGVWKKITRNILNDSNSELFSQGEAQGDYDLRLTISRYLHSSRGVNCEPQQIIIGAGNDYLLMLLEKILGRHVCIAMENPTYKRAYHIFQSFHYPIITVDMDENGMKAENLEQKDVNIAYVMPSHQFPTGIVMPIKRRTELLKWADKSSDRYLIEDDYDSEFRYRGKPIPSLQASDEHGKVIYIGTFSKAIAPAIRVSYMVLPKTLLSKYWQECYFYSCTVSRIDQKILNEFIKNGYFERHLNKMRKHYRTKHEVLLECLRPFEKKFQISGEHAGLHLLLTAKEKEEEEKLVVLAAKKSVKVYGLSQYMEENTNSRGKKAAVLVGYGGLKEEEIRKGIELLKEAWL